jgi:acetate kinase
MAVILVLNTGSSSIKFAAFGRPVGTALLSGQIADTTGTPRLVAKGVEWGAPQGRTTEALLQWLLKHLAARFPEIAAVGHRVVHGGLDFAGPARLTPPVRKAIEALSALAPQHQPHNLAGIDAVAHLWPRMPQVACFDTAFHRGMPEEEQLYPLPRAVTATGIRRYGFHGLSYDYIAGILPGHLPAGRREKVIVAHLGHGASLCALLHGRSVATTMGFTALDGIMMATRSGSVDPGILLHLLIERQWTPEDVSAMLYDKSGLLGVSGLSDDMRVLLASREKAAADAINLFTYRIARETASLITALGGLDALVFTGGIGENAAPIRAAVCRRLAWTGLLLDQAANEAGDPAIAAPDSPIALLALKTDEESVIAKSTDRLIRSGG